MRHSWTLQQMQRNQTCEHDDEVARGGGLVGLIRRKHDSRPFRVQAWTESGDWLPLRFVDEASADAFLRRVENATEWIWETVYVGPSRDTLRIKLNSIRSYYKGDLR